MPRVVLITGSGRRHAYVSRVLARSLEVAGVVAEQKVPVATYLSARAPDDALVRKHFAERDDIEAALLGRDQQFTAAADLLPIEHGRSNDAEVYRWVIERKPDMLLLFGSSIIRPPLLDHFAGRTVNLHLGLSPFYRGSGTNFWPLSDGLPECVGATVHLATLEVDGGDVLSQSRPQGLEPGDRCHQIGTKALLAGADLLRVAAQEYFAETRTPVPQVKGEGKLCRRRDFGAVALRRMHDNFERGMIADYLADKPARDAAFPIVE